MCKIEFHDSENGIEFLKFSIEKVLKKYGKWFFLMCGNPELCITECDKAAASLSSQY